ASVDLLHLPGRPRLRVQCTKATPPRGFQRCRRRIVRAATLLTISRLLAAILAPASTGDHRLFPPPAVWAMPPSILRIASPRRLILKFSVRTRIAAITLIPVLGFLANGIAYVSGERAVDQAVDSVRQATSLADASREFKSAVGSMQAAARSFALRPQASYLQILSDAQAAANAEFVNIQLLSGGQQAKLDVIERTLVRLRGSFAELRKEYEHLGGEDGTGIRSKLKEAAADVERMIGREQTWLTDDAAQRLLASLLSMRRAEAAYML